MNQHKNDFNLILNEFNEHYYKLNKAIHDNNNTLVNFTLKMLYVYYDIFNEYSTLFPDVTSLYLRKIKRIFNEHNFIYI